MRQATLTVMGLFMRTARSAPVTASASRTNTQSSHTAQSPPYNAQRAMTASAERITIDPRNPTALQRPYSAWQTEAWTGYEQVGEVHYGFNLLANLLSRVRLYAGVIGEPNEAPVDVTKAADSNRVNTGLAAAAAKAMEDLLATDAPGMIRNFSLNMSVGGECYLIWMPLKGGGKQWTIRSVEEVTVTPTGIRLQSLRGQGQELTILPPDTFIARMWRPNPRFYREPDSSMVGVADPIKTLLMLERLMRGAIRSRLNAGLLFVPDSISGAANALHTADPVLEEPGTIEDLANAATSDPSGEFLADLIESMSTPLVDESSASSLVPMVVKGPADAGEKIRHITFERPSDEWLVKRAENALERILNGIDIPKEIVTGLQQVKYSNAVVIDENLYKSNIEPLALALADALTHVYLHAVLRAQGFPEDQVRKVVTWYDPSEIVTRPNAADDATQGFDRGVLSPAAWRREHGFPESDAPDDEDLLTLLLSKINNFPEPVLMALFRKLLGSQIDLEEEPSAAPAPVVRLHTTGAQAAQPPADPQRTAVQQVGQR